MPSCKLYYESYPLIGDFCPIPFGQFYCKYVCTYNLVSCLHLMFIVKSIILGIQNLQKKCVKNIDSGRRPDFDHLGYVINGLLDSLTIILILSQL